MEAREPSDATVDDVIARFGTQRHGVAAVAELTAAGVPWNAIARRMRRGALHEVAPRVVLIGDPHWTLPRLWTAAVLSAGEAGVLSARSGAEAHGWLHARPERVAVVGGAGVKPRDIIVRWPGRGTQSVIEVRRHSPVLPPVRTPDSLPTLSPPELVLGVAARASDRELLACVRNAEFQRAIDDGSLRYVLGKGRTGSKRLRKIVDGRPIGATRSRSQLEEVARDLFRVAGLPMPLTNVPVPLVGVPIMTADFYWAALRLIIEADGPAHSLPTQAQLDRERDARFAAIGITVLRFTEEQLRQRPHEVIAAVRTWLATERPDFVMP